MRLLAGLVVVLGLGLVSTADAQVFKPKGKKSDAAEKKPAKPAAKKKAATKKAKPAKKKSAVAERSRPDDLTPDPVSTDDDEDYVKIIDDDDIE